MRLLSLVAVAIVVPLVACVVSSEHTEPAPDQGPTPAPTSTGPQAPMLVTVDTGQVMSMVTGGDGVGVFVQYSAGGHWLVKMTCDTNKSGQNCDFDVKLTPDSGAITNYVATPATTNPANLATLGANGLEATALMTNQVASFTFDTDPGMHLTLDSTVSGLRYYVDSTGVQHTFFFFVSKNSAGSEDINGGFTGTLTNPLTFEPSAP